MSPGQEELPAGHVGMADASPAHRATPFWIQDSLKVLFNSNNYMFFKHKEKTFFYLNISTTYWGEGLLKI